VRKMGPFIGMTLVGMGVIGLLYGVYIVSVNQQNLAMLTSPISTVVTVFGEIIDPIAVFGETIIV
jgi:hypothetical protein